MLAASVVGITCVNRFKERRREEEEANEADRSIDLPIPSSHLSIEPLRCDAHW